ncbi:PspC domain-containing protein [Anoxybacterium hadale]|uniref:PspC domain-containing protein n=1 Tax=Anoxybacterium hadale TaxID=3408580 RepID=A0ACD1AG25_9FIRM|nr:PspC domain-containing protein [Clostridiales bacterium]
MERKLYKSSNDKVLAGVCGGIGEYFAIDSVIVRLLWVVFTLMGGAGLIAYIIAAIIMPENYPGAAYRDVSRDYERDGSDAENYRPMDYDPQSGRGRGNGTIVLGIIFLLLGGSVLLKNFVPQIPDELLLAVFLIGLGVFFLSRRNRS